MLIELLLLAVLVEAATEIVKDIRNKGLTFHQVVALVFGQLLAWGSGLNVLMMVGVEGSPWLSYVGYVLTGLIISRGAGYVHALWDRLAAVKG